jgi:hypothetical protein
MFKSDPKCKHFGDFIKLRNFQNSQKIDFFSGKSKSKTVFRFELLGYFLP